MKTTLIPMLFLFVYFLSGCSHQPAIYSEIVGDGEDQIEIVVVEGTPYEMGFLLGKHLKDRARETLSLYLKAAFKEGGTLFVPDSLEKAWKNNLPYIDPRLQEEMEGFSAGAGIELKKLQEAHAIPIIAPYSCSGVSAWGKATSDSCLYQIRNLDYSTQAGLQKYPLVVIYKPDKGIAHANITFAGTLSSHSGINAASIVLGEKGESPSKEFPYNLNGNHFTILFRKLLYDEQNLSDVESVIENTPLIKRYYLFVGDGKRRQERAVKYLVSTPDSVKWHKWTDNDNSDIHVPEVFKNVTYYTIKNDLAAQFIHENYGRLDAEKMIQLSRLIAGKENLVNIIYNATDLEVWISNATGHESASMRKYVHIDLKKYFND